MKTEKTMVLAFAMNVAFSAFELVGGMLTGSVAILSDAVHDLGDALGIGMAYLFEKKSKMPPDNRYTYGYGRYTVLGGVVTSLLLLLGSAVVIYNAVSRIWMPAELHYDGMLIVAVVGVCVNGGAALLTRRGETLNQKAVFWHLLEDVLGWAVVLVGALVIRVTEWVWIDPLLSVGVGLFVGIHAWHHVKEGARILLEKAPSNGVVDEVRTCIGAIEGVVCVEHLHIWSIDGECHSAAVHLQINGDGEYIKKEVRTILNRRDIVFQTVGLEYAENVHISADFV